MITMNHQQVFTCETQEEFEKLLDITKRRFDSDGKYPLMFKYDVDQKNLTITIHQSFPDYIPAVIEKPEDL